ncbi:MAG: serine/threonine protein kinase [Myxococcales bacterium]|nr:serine/threonine protein kinase [Myxococcales bacterium]MCB9576783.1 serine/threonine protein kinase [Polyangiaceae bacterium]
MAAVWAARLKGSRGFSKTVAVKTMLPTISDDPHFEQMFLDEAQICSRIRHPNVVEILDLGEQDDLLYLVMEWVDGEPLSSIRRAAAKREGIPRPIAVKVVADAAAGLHAAHELKDEHGEVIGLVHRDISPQNVLITYDGVVKIVDFGVAKAAGRTAENTNAGQIKGKPPYMSPEQALGKDIDRRSDLFALGIILYQLTTGKHPFRGENDVITLQNIVSDRPIIPPRAYDKEYPKPLEAVVMRALERDPDKRFQTAAELEAALDRVFPPTVPRVRTEDVGKFVTAMLGERGEERRTALRDAIRQADERAASGETLSSPTASRAMGELGTTVGTAPPGSPAALALSSGIGHTPLSTSSGISIPRPPLPSAHEVTSSEPHSIPQTPFGTQTPTEPPPAPKSRGALWVVGGLFIAALFVGGALLVTRYTGSQASAQAPEHAPTLADTKKESSKPDSVDTDKPATDKPVDDSDAVDLTDLAVEKTATAAPQHAPVVKGPITAKTADKPKEPEKKPEAKKPEEKKPATKKPGGGFVPPPVTDPGF